MLTRRLALAALATTAALSLAGPAAAADARAFDQAAFEAAQAAGKPILVEVTAPWCSTCKAQAPILSRLGSDPRFKDMVRFNIDFDSKKDLLRTFKVRAQSTLIVFKGRQEAGRSTGDTNPASIEALLTKAI
jgi:thiol-disulfide isomerase/thioredoxin